jgi:hypothetical protein
MRVSDEKHTISQARPLYDPSPSVSCAIIFIWGSRDAPGQSGVRQRLGMGVWTHVSNLLQSAKLVQGRKCQKSGLTSPSLLWAVGTADELREEAAAHNTFNIRRLCQ